MAQAVKGYEGRRGGLGVEFLKAVRERYERLERFAHLYPVVRRGIRRATLHRFSYGIYYRIEPQAVVVVAVLHGSARGRRWRSRAGLL